MECFCYQRNVQDLLADAKTPHERRFETPLLGAIIFFGTEINDHPITTKDKTRLHQLGATILRGIFVGHASSEGERLDWRSEDSKSRTSNRIRFLPKITVVICQEMKMMTLIVIDNNETSWKRNAMFWAFLEASLNCMFFDKIRSHFIEIYRRCPAHKNKFGRTAKE